MCGWWSVSSKGNPWVGHHASSHFPDFLISLPHYLQFLWQFAMQFFQTPEVLPLFLNYSEWQLLPPNPMDWAGFRCPAGIKGYFVTCSSNSQKAEDSKKTQCWPAENLSQSMPLTAQVRVEQQGGLSCMRGWKKKGCGQLGTTWGKVSRAAWSRAAIYTFHSVSLS